MIKLTINGIEREVGSLTLESLFLELGLSSPLVLVEYNSLALHRSEWEQVVLSEGDRLELMLVAAGG
jgi:thiamine biosynthesis protein ThiS